MIQTLVKNWWLLAFCGILDGMLSAIYLIMQTTNGPILGHTWNSTVVLAGKLTMLAGVCTVAAAIWRSREGRSWALALSGLALAILGFTQYGLTRYPISILVIALLVSITAVSLGIAEIVIGRTMSSAGRRGDSWFFTAMGLLSVAVVLPSLILGLRWIPVRPDTHVDLLWLGAYFGFAAVCLMALALRLHRQGFIDPSTARA